MRMKKLLCIYILLFNSLIIIAQNNKKIAYDLNNQANKIFNKIYSKTAKDSLSLYRSVIKIVNLSLKSNEYDQKQNNKGVILPKYYNENRLRIRKLYPSLIDAGNFLTKNIYTTQEGIEAYELYLLIRKTPFVTDMDDESGIAAYYLSYHYLKIHNFKYADMYADIALQYDETALEASEIKAECMQGQMKTADDSLKYIAVVLKLYETEPNNEKYLSWIINFYQNSTKNFNIENFIDYQLVNNTNSIVPWILKAEIATKNKRWDEAIEAYKFAATLDKNNIPISYNIGVCLNMKGLLIRKNVLNNKKNNKNLKDTDFLSIFAEAKKYLEIVRLKDPRRNKVDWVTPLYTTYTILGDTIQAKELETLINKLGN